MPSTYNWRQVWETTYPVPSTGKHTSVAKIGKSMRKLSQGWVSLLERKKKQKQNKTKNTRTHVHTHLQDCGDWPQQTVHVAQSLLSLNVTAHQR